MDPSRNGSWKTRELREAEAGLAAAVVRGREAVVRAQRLSARVPQTRIGDEDLQQIDRAARARGAAPELRALAERVERGELTWRQIVDGDAMDDPGVRAAMRANLARLGQVYRKFEEGYTLDEVLDAEAPARRPDDGGDGDGTVLKHNSW
jgi:hypothetical protein